MYFKGRLIASEFYISELVSVYDMPDSASPNPVRKYIELIPPVSDKARN